MKRANGKKTFLPLTRQNKWTVEKYDLKNILHPCLLVSQKKYMHWKRMDGFARGGTRVRGAYNAIIAHQRHAANSSTSCMPCLYSAQNKTLFRLLLLKWTNQIIKRSICATGQMEHPKQAMPNWRGTATLSNTGWGIPQVRGINFQTLRVAWEHLGWFWSDHLSNFANNPLAKFHKWTLILLHGVSK